jgi:hypothetical protein
MASLKALDKRLKPLEVKIISELERKELAQKKWLENPTLPYWYLDSYKDRLTVFWAKEYKEVVSSLHPIVLQSGFIIDSPSQAAYQAEHMLQYERDEVFTLNIIGLLTRQYIAELIEAIEKELSIVSQPREIDFAFTNPPDLLAQVWLKIKQYKERFFVIWQSRTTNSNRKDNDVLLSGQTLDEEINGSIIKNNLISVACEIHGKLDFYLILSWYCLETNQYCFLKDIIETIEQKGW